MDPTTGSLGRWRHPPEEVLLAFTRALRAAGVAVAPDRAHGFLEAVGLVGLDDRQAVYRAGRATLCGSPEDLLRYDQVFEAFFDPADGLPRTVPAETTRPLVSNFPEADEAGEPGDRADVEVRAAASAVEVLRQRDIAELSHAERARLAAMFATLRVRTPTRRTARHERWHHGLVDGHGTLRQSLRRMGEPADIVRRRRRVRARRVVLLVDVSGSMSEYADAVLRLAHRISTAATIAPRAEVFTVGTRLTRVTRAMRFADPDRALVAAGDTVPDWSGGTRLGETLRVFLDRWGIRGLARGAVVVVFSDGWERGDPRLLGEQMARLHRVAHRVVWVNPHRGKAGYEPVQQGVLAALPHVDHFLAGHSLATFAELLEVIERA